MKRILITGALGHIGSRFIHSIKQDDFEKVIIIDNLLTQRYVSLFDLPENVKYQFYEDDICVVDLERYFEGIDIVLHLAAITDAERSFDIKEKVENVNIEGTKRVAEACSKCGCKLIFISTTSVYGTQSSLVDENCAKNELAPQSPYAHSKLKAEKLIEEIGKQKQLEYIIFRFGTIFGTSIGMRFHTAINKFIWQACANIPITVWKTALYQKRPYLNLTDGISALKFVIENNIFDNNIYNILTTNSSVSEIIEIIKEFIPHLKIEYVDSKIMNQLSYLVSNSKFKAKGFNYSENLAQGIQDTIKLIQNMTYREHPFNV